MGGLTWQVHKAKLRLLHGPDILLTLFPPPPSPPSAPIPAVQRGPLQCPVGRLPGAAAPLQHAGVLGQGLQYMCGEWGA